MIGYRFNGPALGAFAKSTDFFCLPAGGGNYVCRGRTPAVTSAYAQLQQTIKTIAAKMAAAGKLSVPPDLAVLAVDGAIGKITSLGVQFIGAAFAPHKDPPGAVKTALTPGQSAEQIVEAIAANAAEITAYFADVLTNSPEATTNVPPPKRMPWGVVTASVAVLAGLAVATYFATRNKNENAAARWF